MNRAEILNHNQRIVNALRVNLNGTDDLHDVTKLVDDLTAFALRAADGDTELHNVLERRQDKKV